MMLSKTATHAVTAFSVLAERADGVYVGAGDIAREIDAPQNYLGKLLKDFADAGLLESQKGKGGGFRLARSPSKITLFDVVEPIDHVSRWASCFLGHPQCSDDVPCPVHCRWREVREVYLRFLRETTIDELARGRQPNEAAVLG